MSYVHLKNYTYTYNIIEINNSINDILYEDSSEYT